jgi:hypothetical protein
MFSASPARPSPDLAKKKNSAGSSANWVTSDPLGRPRFTNNFIGSAQKGNCTTGPRRILAIFDKIGRVFFLIKHTYNT